MNNLDPAALELELDEYSLVLPLTVFRFDLEALILPFRISPRRPLSPFHVTACISASSVPQFCAKTNLGSLADLN